MTEPGLPEEVNNWLYFSGEDLQSAEIMLREKIYNKVCFLSQQTVEKALKAYLLSRGKELKRTHKIVDLLSECAGVNPGFEKFEEDAVALDRFYIPTRYPDAIIGTLPEGLPKKEHAEEALRIAFKIYEFARKELGI